MSDGQYFVNTINSLKPNQICFDFYKNMLTYDIKSCIIYPSNQLFDAIILKGRKNCMKRSNLIRRMMIIIFVMTMIITSAMPVFADTIIDYVLYTDIRTYINDIEITSYNIKGYTAVVVEDLANYGFDVAWDGAARTLKVARNTGKAVTGAAVSTTSGGKVGDKAMPVYATDIKTYLDGQEVESYNVGGRTIVYVDKLAELYASDYKWDASAKTLSAVLKGETKKAEPVKEEPKKEEKKPETISEFIKNNGKADDDSVYHVFYRSGLITYPEGSTEEEQKDYNRSIFAPFDTYQMYVNMTYEETGSDIDTLKFTLNYTDKEGTALSGFIIEPVYISTDSSTGESTVNKMEKEKVHCTWYSKDWGFYILMEINTNNLSIDTKTGKCTLKSTNDISIGYSTINPDTINTDEAYLNGLKGYFEMTCEQINKTFKDKGSDLTIIDVFNSFN